MFHQLTFLFFLLFICHFGQAQTDSVAIRGTVFAFGAENEYLANADVMISDGSDTILRLKTDEFGKFKGFIEVELGKTYTSTFRHANYAENSSEFEIEEPNQTFYFQMSLIKLLILTSPAKPEISPNDSK